MKPKYHILLGTLFLIIFYFIFPETSLINLTILWFSTWLIIDLDYPLIYFLKNKNINPMRFIDYYKKKKKIWESLSLDEKRKFKFQIRIFHNLEFFLLIFVFSIKFNFLIYLLIGFSFHLILDWIYDIMKRESVLKKVSLIYVIINNKKRKELKI